MLGKRLFFQPEEMVMDRDGLALASGPFSMHCPFRIKCKPISPACVIMVRKIANILTEIA